MFVLDEADEMLSRGFKDQIYDIFTKLPTNVQVWQSCSNTKKLNHLQICACKFLEMYFVEILLSKLSLLFSKNVTLGKTPNTILASWRKCGISVYIGYYNN